MKVTEEAKRRHKAMWCCLDCGNKWGEPRGCLITVHTGTCEVCLKTDVTVTHVRDFGYLKRSRLDHAFHKDREKSIPEKG